VHRALHEVEVHDSERPLHRHDPSKTLAEVEFALTEWRGWYNNACLHSRLGYLTPAEHCSQHPPRRPNAGVDTEASLKSVMIQQARRG
jgi:hypothetical protein